MLLLFLDDFVMSLLLDVVYVVVLGCLWLMWLIFLGDGRNRTEKKSRGWTNRIVTTGKIRIFILVIDMYIF